ncbi:hypothetical protein WA158_006880 [Blastocystis sp. Blastoise]
MSFYGGTTSYRKDKYETTEWEDILAEHHVIPRRQDLDKAFDEVIQKYEPQKEENPYEGKELSDLEDIEEEDLSDDDLQFLEEYKNKRMNELKAVAEKNRFGYIIDITRDEFINQVTRANSINNVYDVVTLYTLISFLHSYCTILDCKLMLSQLQLVAERNPDVKFVKIISTDCIKGFPDQNLPCLIVYHEQQIVKQFMGLDIYGGKKFNSECIEWVLQGVGCVKTDLEEDPRLSLRTTFKRI